MATVEECEQALGQLSTSLSGRPGGSGGLDRSVSCRIRDLGVVFAGRFRDGSLQDLVRAQSDQAEIRVSMGSDDLLALVGGTLGFAGAWSSGRLSVKGSIFDLLKLRKML